MAPCPAIAWRADEREQSRVEPEADTGAGEDGDDGVPEGIDAAAVTSWLAERVEALAPPLRFGIVAGGRSNLTFTITDAEDRRWVLRRPPLHHVLESAHDVAREARLMSALADSAVPVPPVVGVEEDASVNGAPFYVMDFVDGIVVRDPEVAATIDPAVRRASSDALVDTLLALHAVDVDAVGLGDLARHDGYVARQLKRWHGQYHKAREGGSRELPLVDEVHARLSADVPEQQRVAIVHGDYRLDNVIVDPEDGRVRAVLDWELCTLGDPMADVGLLHVYWSEPGDETIPLVASPTTVEGFASRAEVIERYRAGSDLDLSRLGYYLAFGWWKLAIILEGVLIRFTAGAYGDHVDEGVKAFARVVETLLVASRDALDEAGER